MFYGPKIITNGLVLYLDAANRNSYPGSGTTWTDLSGNSNNGTLTNGPTFSSANGGHIVFDGTNDYLSLNSALNFSTSTGFTICMFLQKVNNQSGTAWNYFYSNNSPTIEIGGYGQTGTSFVFKDNTVANTEIGSQDIVSSWSYISFGTNASTRTSYIYTLNPTVGTVLTTSVGSVSNLTLGFERFFTTGPSGGPAGTTYFRSKCATIQAYNRVLTSTEVLQNYNATKSRFGI
jgi:hypothetical protein